MDPSVKTILEFMIIPFTALVTWLFARRKNEADVRKIRAETSGQEIKNVESIVQFWQKMADDLTVEMVELKKEIISFATENKSLRKQLNDCVKKNESMDDKVRELERKLTGQ